MTGHLSSRKQCGEQSHAVLSCCGPIERKGRLSIKVAEELFVIPDDTCFLLFLPLKGSVLRVTPSVVFLLKMILRGMIPCNNETMVRQLLDCGVLECDRRTTGKSENKTIDLPFTPTRVTLFPTTDCNLRCIYCYASGGDRPLCMEWNVAKAAVDNIVQSAIEGGVNGIHISFHGGGEPTYGKSWDLVRRTIEYARNKANQYGIGARSSIATNGVMDDLKREWIRQNVDSVAVSFDGPKDIQNLQRPLASGRESIHFVVDTIRFLESTRAVYALRATVTQRSIYRLREVLDFLCSISSLQSFHLEPVFECGRCPGGGEVGVPPELFLNRLVDVVEYARSELHVSVHYSGVSGRHLRTRFCGACGENFAVTTEGKVTSCYEVSCETDVRSADFFFGQYEPSSRQFRFDACKLNRLRDRTIENLNNCRDCFAKYACAGDCPAKTQALCGDMFSTDRNWRCIINRGLVVHGLRRLLERRPEHEP